MDLSKKPRAVGHSTVDLIFKGKLSAVIYLLNTINQIVSKEAEPSVKLQMMQRLKIRILLEMTILKKLRKMEEFYRKLSVILSDNDHYLHLKRTLKA